ncbi:MAG: galactokinase [Sedimentisphaeraceae bacterium JB056]
MEISKIDSEMFKRLKIAAKGNGLDIEGGKVCRSSSRFCLGVEHGDYNGTELFGVGTDRFIWMAYKPNNSGKFRFFSENFPNDGIIEFDASSIPAPMSIPDSWARFPYGVAYILKEEGYELNKGFDAVLYGNIPGGGMSRSASLTLNLILSMCDANGIEIEDQLTIIDIAVAVENKYIGSPCGELDQIMILFAKEGMGTHYNPADRSINYVPLGEGATDFRIIGLDTGTVRPGLEKSSYKIRRAQCEELVEKIKAAGYEINCLADIKDEALYNELYNKFSQTDPALVNRMKYIYGAQQRFYKMLDAWRAGDIETVGAIFREDGIGLRDDYIISGPELESMCDIVRTVDGVLGERMLGGGDKGAAGALVKAEAVEQLEAAVNTAYPRSRPHLSDKYAVHVCKVVDGIKTFEDVI